MIINEDQIICKCSECGIIDLDKVAYFNDLYPTCGCGSKVGLSFEGRVEMINNISGKILRAFEEYVKELNSVWYKSNSMVDHHHISDYQLLLHCDGLAWMGQRCVKIKDMAERLDIPLMDIRRSNKDKGTPYTFRRTTNLYL